MRYCLNGVRQRESGFTLVELAVVIVIIGVLAAFGVPRFKVAVEKSKAAEAFTYLGSVRSSQERYFTQAGVYSNQVNLLDINMATPAYFNLTALTADQNGWEGTMTRITPSAGYGAYTVLYNEQGFDSNSSIVNEINPQFH
jgi:prepilin-type N-terminal cleavage/methylation domain-containing protein